MHDWTRWVRLGLVSATVAALAGCCVIPPFYAGFCGPGGGYDRGGERGGHGGRGGGRHHLQGQLAPASDAEWRTASVPG